MKCVECDGTGFVAGGFSGVELCTCGECNGTGKGFKCCDCDTLYGIKRLGEDCETMCASCQRSYKHERG